MYCNLLDEVIKEMQGKEIEAVEEIQIDINVSSYIPDEYISDSAQKIEMYQDIALCKTEADIQNVIDEMIDRFGTLPMEVNNLLEVARIKQLCKIKKINKLAQREDNLVIYFNKVKITEELIQKLICKYGSKIRFSQSYITLKIDGMESIKEFLNII